MTPRQRHPGGPPDAGHRRRVLLAWSIVIFWVLGILVPRGRPAFAERLFGEFRDGRDALRVADRL